MEYLKTVFTKVYIRLLIAAGICVVAGLILVAVGVRNSSKLVDQQITERWGNKKDFAQISVFFSELAGFDENGAEELKHNIEKELKEASITNENEGAKLLQNPHRNIHRFFPDHFQLKSLLLPLYCLLQRCIQCHLCFSHLINRSQRQSHSL